MVKLWTIAVRLYGYAGPVVMLAYPLYASVMAIESPTKEDETQWLTYWVLYSFVQLIELGLSRVLYFVPFWYTIKLVALAWLVLPEFHGAAFVYENFVKKYMGKASAGKGEKLSSQQRQGIEQMSPHARASVSAFIDEYGSDAFDSVMRTATNTAAERKSSKQE